MSESKIALESRAHFELMEKFERDFPHERLDREKKSDWQCGIIYQNGNTNAMFKAYRIGYAHGLKCIV